MNITKDSVSVPVPDFKCSLCGGPLTAFPADGINLNKGVTVMCLGACIPTCHESPFGFGANVKEAYEILCQKYRKTR
jgi:hypothetical protein